MRRTLILLMTLTMLSCSKQPQASDGDNMADSSPSLQISVTRFGKILVDGKETTLVQLDVMLTELKNNGGTVWYYREAGQGEPPVEAMEVIKLIAAKELPVTLSSKPDFSDYVGQDGRPRPREK